MNFPQKALLWFGLLAILVSSCARKGTGVPVTTTQAKRQDLTSWISSNGKVEPVEPHVIQSQLTTFIQTVSVKQGDTVKRGQLLMTLDAKDLESELSRVKGELVTAEDEHRIAAAGGSPDELAQLQSDLAKTDTEIARLRREAESLDRLYAKQAATRQELEQNKLALDRAEADKRLIEQKKNATKEVVYYVDESGYFQPDTSRFNFKPFQGTLDEGKTALNNGGSFGFLYVPKFDLANPDGITLYTKVSPSPTDIGNMERIFANHIRDLKMQQLNVDKEVLDKLKTSVTINSVKISEEGNEKSSDSKILFGVGMAVSL